jgi:hypothetical protein
LFVCHTLRFNDDGDVDDDEFVVVVVVVVVVEFEVAFGSDGNRDGINLTKSGVNVITIV